MKALIVPIYETARNEEFDTQLNFLKAFHMAQIYQIRK